MRIAWSALAVVAVANLLALAGFVGWLVHSERIDAHRLRTIREMLAETVREQAAREQEVAEAIAAAEAAREPDPQMAISTAEMLGVRMELGRVDTLREERLRRDAQALRESLAQQERVLRQREEALRRERDAFEAERERIERVEGSQQFAKAVKVLEGLRPAEAAEMLRATIDGREAGGEQGDLAGIAGAVEYLNAMRERGRLKVMGEIARQDPELAAELLERLRTRGLAAADAGVTGDAGGPG